MKLTFKVLLQKICLSWEICRKNRKEFSKDLEKKCGIEKGLKNYYRECLEKNEKKICFEKLEEFIKCAQTKL